MANNNLQEALSKTITRYFAVLDGTPPKDLYDLILSQIEPTLLREVMQRARGNQCQASRWLGMSEVR